MELPETLALPWAKQKSPLRQPGRVKLVQSGRP
jgi:hypothetical protein